MYRYTLQAVTELFARGCELVILACNTASAKALRSIQQQDLPHMAPDRRVLGVIRPTVEAVGDLTRTRHVGILGTQGTIRSKSYELEIAKFQPRTSSSRDKPARCGCRWWNMVNMPRRAPTISWNSD